MALDQFPDFLTVEEAASVLRIGRSLAYQLARQWRVTGGRTACPSSTLDISCGCPGQRWPA